MISETLKLTALVNVLSVFKIPLLAFTSPRITKIGGSTAEVKMHLDWRTRNHVGVMYFGALAMGAELSVAATAVNEIQKSGQNVDFIFKDFKCDFHKRADGSVVFTCDQASEVADLIHRALQSDERLEGTYKGYAKVPSKSDDVVMDYSVTLSVRHRR